MGEREADAAPPPGPAAPGYAVPALDKALDIVELLADTAGGMTQTEIAAATGRSVGQIYRVLVALEARGWILREPTTGLYAFSMAAFDLAHRHPPLRGLLAAAESPMRELVESVRQSCNLSVLDAGVVRVIAQVESPADFGYRVRVGAVFAIEEAATGAVLAAGAPEPLRAELLARVPARQREQIAADGSLRRVISADAGIVDLVVPIRGADGGVRAALTVPYIATGVSSSGVDAVHAAASRCAERIGDRLRGFSQSSAR